MALTKDTYFPGLSSTGATQSTSYTLRQMLNAAMPGGAGASDEWLLANAQQAGQRVEYTLWSDGLPQSGTATWPDGTTGAWSAHEVNADWGVVIAYDIAHVSGQTVRVTYTLDLVNMCVHNPVASILGGV